MPRLALTVALLFLACACASPAPKPDNPKFTLVKDSTLGVGVATQHGNAHGVVDSNVGLDTPVESPIDTGDKVHDVTLVENVNTGYAFAGDGSVATGVLKNNKFAKNPMIPVPSTVNGFSLG